MSLLSIRETKHQAGADPAAAKIHVQVAKVLTKQTKQGDDYVQLEVADSEDRLTVRFFKDSPMTAEAKKLKDRQFVEIDAKWLETQFGVEPREVKLRALEDEEIEALLAGPAALQEKQGNDYAFIEGAIGAMADPRLAAICATFLSRNGERFRRSAGARTYHHARRGGLVEHVAQMMRCAIQVCVAYPYVNRDLVVAGVLFHDCGKLWENCYEESGFVMPYTIHGELLGHIPMGIELVNRLWRDVALENSAAWAELDPPSETVRLHLLHLIGSHHGEYQFGAPVLPRTPEALVLHHVDNIDAKLEMMKDGYEKSSQVADGIFERMRPLPSNQVAPLAHFEIGEDPEPEESPGNPF